MKGLIWKDLLVQRGNGVYLFLVMLLMTTLLGFIGQSISQLLITNGTIILILMITQGFGYDHTSKWDVLATSMPLKRSSFVLAKYAFAFLGTLFIAICFVLPALIIEKESLQIAMAVFFGYISFMLVFFSFALMIYFVFGVKKAYYVMPLSIGGFMAGFIMIFEEEENRAFLVNYVQKFSAEMLALQFAALVLIMVGVSIMISIRAFAKKDF